MVFGDAESIPRIAFVDYHGVLTDLSPECLASPPDVSFVTLGSLRALRLLTDCNIFVISNQVGVAFGDYDTRKLDEAIISFVEELRGHGVLLNGFLYCSHHPEAKIRRYKTPCLCRKPGVGLIYRALAMVPATNVRCVFIGDTLETDIACALAASMPSIWINKSGDSPWRVGTTPDVTCSSVLDAVPFIKHFLTEGVVLSFIDYP
jgi:D-glycero-D-manno-heptose 1,7-bisphosphate phosphatase